METITIELPINTARQLAAYFRGRMPNIALDLEVSAAAQDALEREGIEPYEVA